MMTVNLRIDADAASNSIYIYLSTHKDGVVGRSVRVSEDMLVDLDEDGTPVGIEIINASLYIGGKGK